MRQACGMKLILLALCMVLSAYAQNRKLPEKFFLGFATASYQVEGAWNEDGKGETTWDRFTHENPDNIDDRSNGDIAADEYHKITEDIQHLVNLGAQTYRFSLSWARILPDGQPTVVNEKGVQYYNKVINLLLENNIQPMVTLFHWDLPQRLQDLGGWPNYVLSDYFEDYARLAFTLFGDRVKQWITFNEPYETCYSSYGFSEKAPGINMPGIAEYLCAHTIIYSHARAYHVYNDTFRPLQKGIIGITLNGGWNEPGSDSPANVSAAARANSFDIGWYAHPIFSETGDYPAVMRSAIDQNSIAEGRMRSRLPQWDAATVDFIKGTYDFYGMNHYTTFYSQPEDSSQSPNPSFLRDRAVRGSQDPNWPSSASAWLKVAPFGIRKLLNYIKDQYNNPVVIVTENGFSDHGELEDDNRINYYNGYLQEILNAYYEDGVNVIGYTAWSLLDNFEWARGYTEKFGVIKVDFDDKNRTRTWKKSANYFKALLANRELPQPLSNGSWPWVFRSH